MKKIKSLLCCIFMLTKVLLAGNAVIPTSSVIGEYSFVNYLAITAPGTQAKTVTIVNSTADNNSFAVSWVRGNGVACVVFIKLTNTLGPTLTTAQTYTGNTVFGSGTQSASGSGWFCVYNGTGTSVNVTGLTANSTYMAAIYEYNGSAGSEVYNITTIANNKTSLTPNRINPVITFGTLPTKYVGDIDYTPVVTSSSTATKTYTSDDTNVATIVSSKIHSVGVGTTNINFIQTYNATYFAAKVSRVLNVKLTSQAITFAPMAIKHFGDADFDPGATATSGLPVHYSSDNPSVAYFLNGKIHIVGTGTTSITCSQIGDANFYAADNIIQNLEVDKASQTIFFPSLNNAVCNDPNIFPLAVASSGLLVTYTSSNTSVATIQGNQIHIVGAGTTTITALQAGNENYKAAPNVSTPLTVSKNTQTITFAPFSPMNYEDIYLNPASSNWNLAIDYTSSNTAVAVIVNGSIHVVGSGITTITANQTGNANYLAAISVQQILTVNAIGQTIFFFALTNKAYGDADFTLSATANSGLPITYTNSNPSVATLTGNLVHILNAGTTTITAQQAGSTTYTAATDVANTLFVTQKSQNINFTSFQAYAFGDADVPLTATSTSGLPISYSSDNASVATIVAGNVKIIGPGTANITAIQSGNANYLAANSVTRIFSVNKSAQAISFSSLPSVTYGDMDMTLTATASSGLPVTYVSDNSSIATISGSTVHFVSAGSVNIIAMQPGNAIFDAAPTFSNILVVNNNSQSIVFNAFPVLTYGDVDYAFSALATSGLTVSFLNKYPGIASIISGKIHILTAGTDTIVATQPGNGSYSAAVNVPRALVINKASQAIVFNPIPASVKVFGGPDFTLTAAGGGSGNSVVFSSSDLTVATITGNIVTIMGTGTTTITATQSGNGNFNAALPVTQNLTINKAANTITFYALANKTYNDADFDPSATATSGLSVTYSSSNSSVATIAAGKIHIVGTGTSIITASQTGNVNYAAAPEIQQTLTVGQDLQIISFGNLLPRLYGDPDFIPGALASSGLLITYTSDNENVATIVGGKIHIVGGGSCIITASQPGDLNYENAPDVQQTLQVNGVPQTITFDPFPVKAYGNSDFLPVCVSTSGLEVTYTSDNENVATIVAIGSNYAIHITGVGTASIIAHQTGDLSFNQALPATQVLTVIKGNQTINFASIPTKTFGDPDFFPNISTTSNLQVTLTSDNLIVAKIVDGNIRIIGASTATITAYQPGDEHYNAAVNVSKILTVKKVSQTIQFPAIDPKTYGDEDFDPGAYTSSGLNVTYESSTPSVATITFDGSVYLVHIISAGTTMIKASQPGNINCLPANSSISKTLTINKAPLIVEADNFVRNYGEENPIFTAWYSGFMNGDDFTNFGVEPDLATTATVNSPVGDYDIVPSGGSSANYSFIYQTGILTIGVSIPVKPPLPVGATVLCINPDNQVYQINGNSTATTYKWSVTPAEAAIIIGTGKLVDVKFDKSFIGKAGLSTIGENPSGTSIPSDTLFIDVYPMPAIPEIIYAPTYCLNNEDADSIILVNAQKGYLYQLMINGSNIGTPISGTDQRSGWYNLHYGNYSIEEQHCKTTLAKNIVIKEVAEVAKKPKLQVKWNDVIVCNNAKDSLNKYQWYQDGFAIPNATQQFLWTQKKEGKYSVLITDIDGCQSQSDTITISTSAGEIYPNPSSGQFKVSFTNTEKGKVKMNIYRLNSLPLQNLSFTKDLDLFEQDIDLHTIDAGLYFIEILVNDKRVMYEKLIIQ